MDFCSIDSASSFLEEDSYLEFGCKSDPGTLISVVVGPELSQVKEISGPPVPLLVHGYLGYPWVALDFGSMARFL